MKPVKVEIMERVAVLSIVRPKVLNALNREVVDEIDKSIEKISDNEDIRCLIIHSEKNFAAGADIKAMADCDEEGARRFAFSPTYNKISSLKIPTISGIEGYALGGGLELALATDIRIAGESSSMGFPEVTLGIFPGAGGTIRAPKLLGNSIAKELIFTGDIISAEEALRIGLVNHVVADKKVLDEAIKMGIKISRRGPVAVKMAKYVIERGLLNGDVSEGIRLESEEWAKLFNTYDQKEGMRAFIEKRKPQFQNK